MNNKITCIDLVFICLLCYVWCAYQTVFEWRSLPSLEWAWGQTQPDWGCLWEVGEQMGWRRWRREDPGHPGWDPRRETAEQLTHSRRGKLAGWDSGQDQHVERDHLEYKVRQKEEGHHYHYVADSSPDIVHITFNQSLNQPAPLWLIWLNF